MTVTGVSFDPASGSGQKVINVDGADQFQVVNSGAIDLAAGDWTNNTQPLSEIYLDSGILNLVASDNSETTKLVKISLHYNLLSIQTQNGDDTLTLNISPTSMSLQWWDATLSFPRNPGVEGFTLLTEVNGAKGDAVTGAVTIGASEYADNAAALADGKPVGYIYNTAGVLKIVI